MVGADFDGRATWTRRAHLVLERLAYLETAARERCRDCSVFTLGVTG